MTDHEDLITETELDTLLAAASAPPVPLGAKTRMLARLAADTAGNDAALPPPSPSRSRLGWLAGLPLAASLALGIYLGAAGTASDFVPFGTATATASAAASDSDSDTGSGIDDALDFSEDSLT